MLWLRRALGRGRARECSSTVGSRFADEDRRTHSRPVAVFTLFLSRRAFCSRSRSRVAAELLASTGASSAVSASSSSGSSSATITAVAAENEYANVLEQIGGKYVKVTAIESNPNTDPHTYEASPSIAQAVGWREHADRKRGGL